MMKNKKILFGDSTPEVEEAETYHCRYVETDPSCRYGRVCYLFANLI